MVDKPPIECPYCQSKDIEDCIDFDYEIWDGEFGYLRLKNICEECGNIYSAFIHPEKYRVYLEK